MKLFSLFRKERSPRAANRPERPQPSEQRGSVVKEIVWLSLRDTLARARVPADWVGFELLPAAGRGGPRQLHVRLVLLQWDGRLVHSLTELERGFVRRMRLLDATSAQWVRDVSWRLAISLHKLPGRSEGSSAKGSEIAAPGVRPAKTIDRDALLDPGRERHSVLRDGHSDFSPTQPLL
ncbi:hypothetical protein [Ramlibacter sp. Leaf400]|uniref:hypothetical protein n=1 Tax=Ramlibacter sp. Leaf400 TaxID=1736365 RepID=UPI000715DA9A|nr:hypothetical protein [Ramlibacter sp. Leaf400]KQT13848.1 hypothetical protein ASG30_18225 [Ramlibacter sp. Leaf400]